MYVSICINFKSTCPAILRVCQIGPVMDWDCIMNGLILCLEMQIQPKKIVMRKLTYILAGLILVIGLTSCEKKGGIPNIEDAMLKGAISTQNLETPIPSGDRDSYEGFTPMLIPPLEGENNRGGNRTCEAVYFWLGEGEDYLCGDKVDYDGDGAGFASSFPSGLTVTVSGIYTSFTVDGCVEIEIEGEMTYWKVGAVIVKGSNAANIYYYGPDGILSDSELFAPGEKPMLSNLTFCFVPCVPEVPVDEWYAVKVWVNGDAFWAISDGATSYYAGTDHWCDLIGFGDYDAQVTMNLIHYPDFPPHATNSTDIGDVTVNGSGDVTITLITGYTLDQASVYVGEMDDLGATGGCPAYKVTPWAFKDGLAGNTVTFVKGVDF